MTKSDYDFSRADDTENENYNRGYSSGYRQGKRKGIQKGLAIALAELDEHFTIEELKLKLYNMITELPK